MNESMKLTWAETLPVWGSFFWRAIIWGVLFGAGGGFIVGIATIVAGNPAAGPAWASIAGLIGWVPASMVAMKSTLEKHLGFLQQLGATRTPDSHIQLPSGALSES